MDKSYIKFIERKVKNKIFVKKMMLEEKLELKNICLRNRIVMPPMAREASIEGKPSDELIDYYKKRAEYTGL